jgi:ankyrin repeat protein
MTTGARRAGQASQPGKAGRAGMDAHVARLEHVTRAGRAGRGSRGALAATLLLLAAFALLPAALSARFGPGSGDALSVADAAMAKDANGVRAMLKQGRDVNTAQGDGMTALHWAAMHGDKDLATLLLYAGANVRATTRLGGYTPLHLASQAGSAGVAGVIDALAAAGANVDAPDATGVTPLMLAAASGNTDAVAALLGHSADPNAKESAHGETPLMFAAALDRSDVARLLVQHGANPYETSKVVDLTGVVAPEESLQNEIRAAQNARSAAAAKAAAAVAAGAPAAAGAAVGGAPMVNGARQGSGAGRGAASGPEIPGVTRAFNYNELIGKEGGLTALHFAARQGALQTVKALVESGADVNRVSPADNTSPLVIATINGQFDTAAYLLDRGANPNLSSELGMTALYAALNVEWAPRMFYPQPRAYLQQHTSYLQLMQALLDKGADPNLRIRRKVWYTQYNFDLLRVDEGGATPFWRAAYASDIDAMKLLVAHGADPNIPTVKPAGRTRVGDNERETRETSAAPPVPTGGPGIPPLLAAAGAGYGEGFAANAHRFAPSGMLAAVKYLVEELHADVNAPDYEGNTALHNAASRGDNEMIEYLVSKGADPAVVNRMGQTTVDMANGPVQRTQPYPETIKLLEGLGVKNNHKCVSC